MAGELDITIARDMYFGDVLQADADVVVIQRPVDGRWTRVVRQLRANGVAVVADMDDDLWAVDVRHPVYDSAGMLHAAALDTCRAATMVTVTTPALAARYGTPGRLAVIPNFVPEHYLKVPHRDSTTVGWGGSIRIHPSDLQVVGDSIKRVIALGGNFVTAGPPAGVGRALGLDKDPQSPGDVPLEYWPKAISKFGIGIAPLAPTEFNESKSRLRPLEYSAVGVPWIASPAADYVRFHESGAGLLASTPDEWFGHLDALIRTPELRHELADAGREIAKANTIEGNAWRWAEAWCHAYESERKSHV